MIIAGLQLINLLSIFCLSKLIKRHQLQEELRQVALNRSYEIRDYAGRPVFIQTTAPPPPSHDPEGKIDLRRGGVPGPSEQLPPTAHPMVHPSFQADYVTVPLTTTGAQLASCPPQGSFAQMPSAYGTSQMTPSHSNPPMGSYPPPASSYSGPPQSSLHHGSAFTTQASTPSLDRYQSDVPPPAPYKSPIPAPSLRGSSSAPPEQPSHHEAIQQPPSSAPQAIKDPRRLPGSSTRPFRLSDQTTKPPVE